MSSKEVKDPGRREFLKVAAGFVAGLAIGGAGGYYAGISSVPTPVTEKKPPKEEKPAAPKPTAPKPTRTIKIGTTISLSGKYSLSAERWGVMSEKIQEIINERGGVWVEEYKQRLPIEIIYYDDESTPETAVKLYEKLATVDKVDFFWGPDWSPIGFPVSAVIEKYKRPGIMCNVASPKPYTRGFEWVFGTPMPDTSVWSDYYFEMMSKQKPRPTTVAFIAENALWAKDITDFMSKKVDKWGFKVVDYQLFPPETKDFSTILLRVKSLNPDIIYISAYEEPTIAIVKQMRDLDVNAKDIHVTMNSGRVIEALGKAAEYLTGEVIWVHGMKYEGRQLTEEILKRSGVDLKKYIWTMARITSIIILLKAIEEAGTLDPAAVRDVLKDLTFMSPVGVIKFPWPKDPTKVRGKVILPGYPIQVQKGDLVAVYPPEIATGSFKYPRPTWSELMG